MTLAQKIEQILKDELKPEHGQRNTWTHSF